MSICYFNRVLWSISIRSLKHRQRSSTSVVLVIVFLVKSVLSWPDNNCCSVPSIYTTHPYGTPRRTVHSAHSRRQILSTLLHHPLHTHYILDTRTHSLGPAGNDVTARTHTRDHVTRPRDLLLTNREELLLRIVLALPYASRTGLVCTIWTSRVPFSF